MTEDENRSLQSGHEVTTGTPGPSSPAPGAARVSEAERQAQARRERAARTLRENLARRKQQGRARRAGDADDAVGLPAAHGEAAGAASVEGVVPTTEPSPTPRDRDTD